MFLSLIHTHAWTDKRSHLTQVCKGQVKYHQPFRKSDKALLLLSPSFKHCKWSSKYPDARFCSYHHNRQMTKKYFYILKPLTFIIINIKILTGKDLIDSRAPAAHTPCCLHKKAWPLWVLWSEVTSRCIPVCRSDSKSSSGQELNDVNNVFLPHGIQMLLSTIFLSSRLSWPLLLTSPVITGSAVHCSSLITLDNINQSCQGVKSGNVPGRNPAETAWMSLRFLQLENPQPTWAGVKERLHPHLAAVLWYY